jgi:hypothetical protein
MLIQENINEKSPENVVSMLIEILNSLSNSIIFGAAETHQSHTIEELTFKQLQAVLNKVTIIIYLLFPLFFSNRDG